MILCRVCNSDKKKDAFIISDFPSSAQGFCKSRSESMNSKSNLYVFECCNCGLTQISNEPVSYYKEVIRASAYSEDMRLERLKQFKMLESLYYGTKEKKNNLFALEIGAGRGEYMKICDELGWNVLGIENSNQNIQNSEGFSDQIVKGFIEENEIKDISSNIFKKSPNFCIDICYCLNFIEHWPNPLDSLKQLKHLLNSNSLCLFEVPNFNMIKDKGLYAEFIPDHLSYFDVNSFSYLINKAGYEIIKLETFYNEYIISCYCKPTYKSDIEKIKNSYEYDKNKLKKTINKIDGDIYFWGAGHQALAYLSMLGKNTKIKFVIDSAPFKQGYFCPGSGYEIKGPKALEGINNGNIIVCCGGYNVEVTNLLLNKYSKKLKIFTISQGTIELVK